MKHKLALSVILTSILTCITANFYLFAEKNLHFLWLYIPLFLLLNALPGFFLIKTTRIRLRFLCHGTVLLTAFSVSAYISLIHHIALAAFILPEKFHSYLWSGLISFVVLAVLFWNGILCVYLTSVQLGIRRRVAGALVGMIPLANLFALMGIIAVSCKEIIFETEKEQLNRQRQHLKLCATKYPILLVHGVFFRDTKHFNYWGRIPAELEQNGALILYGNHQSAASVPASAAELTARIKNIIRETGCEKVNIIAHSKGGLDCRYAIAKFGIGPYVASLTTVNTPHRGCLFADYLLSKAPEKFKTRTARAYNTALKKLGDPNPDFLAAVNDLTAQRCFQLNREMPTPEKIFCQSVGSVLSRAGSGQFPLNVSYHLANHFSGSNDGLVSENSFSWGKLYTLLDRSLPRGISHGDVIDLNRQNIDGFDVREFYVKMVADLKSRGL